METLLFDLDGTLYPLDNGYHTHVVSPPPRRLTCHQIELLHPAGLYRHYRREGGTVSKYVGECVGESTTAAVKSAHLGRPGASALRVAPHPHWSPPTYRKRWIWHGKWHRELVQWICVLHVWFCTQVWLFRVRPSPRTPTLDAYLVGENSTRNPSGVVW